MCGIWASLGFVADRSRIDRVAHRGPDGSGWKSWESPAGPVALGHRRLAVVGLSAAGLQPMCDPSRRYWLTYNGEIYNFRELRAELAGHGIVFTTETDSEVLLQAYIAWGVECLGRLFGMFAFAIWDDLEKALFIARDRFGIKPLYLASMAGAVAAASEIKQLHDLPGIPRRMNLARVYDFLATGISDHTAETMFLGITQLRGGEFVKIDATALARGAPLQVNRWYRLPVPRTPAPELPISEAAAIFRSLFDQSMRLHLRADVPVGSCLSGGLDSSSIVCAARDLLGKANFEGRFAAISAVFDEARVDERRYIDAVVNQTGARSLRVTLDPAALEAGVAEMVWHQDEPFGSTSICAQGAVFERAHQDGLKVMLDGQGADELLGGYHWLFGPALAHLLRKGSLTTAARMIAARRSIHGSGTASQLLQAFPHLLPEQLRSRAQRLRRSPTGADWLDGHALRSYRDAPSPFAIAAADLGIGGRTDLGAICASLTAATSLPMLLHWEDRSSMMHGIEARVPFLDHKLVEFALGLGSAHKIEGAVTKQVLRHAMADRLPPAVHTRHDKLGFSTPEQEWARGPMRQFMHSGVMATLDRYPALLNRNAAIAMTGATLDGARAFSFAPWRILMVGIWGERFGLSA